MALFLAILVERIFSKFGEASGKLRELRLDLSWTVAGFLIIMLIAVLAAYFFRIVWYEWLNFAFGQFVAFGLKWAFKVVGLAVPTIGKIGRYLFLGSK
jgi:hypothetical protein